MCIRDRYWYGSVLYIPDKNHQLHYVLLAMETDSFYGYGLFFEFRGVLLVILAVLGVSCLWWCCLLYTSRCV